jgi:hypothetical protein
MMKLGMAHLHCSGTTTRSARCSLDPDLALLHLRLGGGTNLDDTHAAGEFRDPFLELFLVKLLMVFCSSDLSWPMRAAIVEGSPAPPINVAVCLPTSIFLVGPKSSMLTCVSERPASSAITRPPVNTAISSNIALRRSPNPGAFGL